MAASVGNGRFSAAMTAPSASPTSRYWQAPRMQRRVFATWTDFFAYLDEYQARTSQVFTRRTGTSVKARNLTLAAAGKGDRALIPEQYEQYSRTLHCTGFKVSAEGKRKRRDGDGFAECKAQINATLKQEANGTYRVHVTKAFLVHNHPLAADNQVSAPWQPSQGQSRAEETSVGSRHVETGSSNSSTASVVAVHQPAPLPPPPTNQAAASAPASKRQRVDPPPTEVREEEASPPSMSLRDFLARMKAHQAEDSTVESRLARYVKEFDEVTGNVAKIFVDDQKVLSCITMQTKNMRKVFDAFPEVLRVECTQSEAGSDSGGNSSYNLLSLLAHDTFGMWQFVQHAVVENGRSDSWTAAVTQLKEFNPKWKNVRAVVVEKNTTSEVAVLRACFPKARVLLSQFHVVKDMHDAIEQRGAELSSWHKDRLCAIVQLLVYAPTELVYRANLRSMVDVLGTPEHPFIGYFNQTWDACRDMWTTHRRENVTTFGANEARRLEPTWREIQASVGTGNRRNDMTLDETIVSIQFYQAMVERNYMAKLRRASSGFSFQTGAVASTPGGLQEYDDEMKLLAATVSPHACQLVYPQYTHALKRAQYRFCEPSRGTFFVSAVVLNDAFCDEPTKEFCVEEKQGWQCSCAFMVNHHLPCRHVFYIRRIVRCDSIVPISTLERRWVLRDVCSFFDSNALTTDAMRLQARDYKDSDKDDADKDPMHDENRNTIVVPPGSWERFVAATDVGKRISLQLMQLEPSEFDRALRYYRIVEQNFCGRSVEPVPTVDGAAGVAAVSPPPATGRPARTRGRPPLHRPLLAPKPAASTQSGVAAAASASGPPAARSERLPTSEKVSSSVSPRGSGELPSLESLSPPVIDLQGESEADGNGANGDGGEETGGNKADDGDQDDHDEEQTEDEDLYDDEDIYEGEEPEASVRETRGSRRPSGSGSSSPSSSVLPRRSSRGRSSPNRS